MQGRQVQNFNCVQNDRLAFYMLLVLTPRIVVSVFYFQHPPLPCKYPPNIILCDEHRPVSFTVVCRWQNILAPIMTVWPSVIFALMCFGMTRSCTQYVSPFLFGLHINREQITQCLDRNISYLSFPIFFLDVSFFCCHLQVLFSYICPDQEMYLSKLQTLFVQSKNGF